MKYNAIISRRQLKALGYADTHECILQLKECGIIVEGYWYEKKKYLCDMPLDQWPKWPEISEPSPITLETVQDFIEKCRKGE